MQDTPTLRVKSSRRLGETEAFILEDTWEAVNSMVFYSSWEAFLWLPSPKTKRLLENTHFLKNMQTIQTLMK